MKNLLKLTALILVLVGSFGSCEEKGDSYASISGKWKLVKVTLPFIGEANNYSQYNIVYEFKTSNVLTVSGETEQIELYRGHEIGDYFYSLIEDDEKKTQYDSRTLKINDTYFWHTVSFEELEITLAPLDGAIYNLVRIK